MIKVWILTLIIEGNSSGSFVNQTYNYTSQKECEVAAQFQKKTLDKQSGVYRVIHSCLYGYVVK